MVADRCFTCDKCCTFGGEPVKLALVLGFAAFLAVVGRNPEAYLMAGVWLFLASLYFLATRKAL